MFSWFTNLSTYYIRLERLAIISAAILLLAFLSFGMIASFELKAVFFVVLSVAIFGMEPIMNRLFDRTKLTEADKAIVKEIRASGLPVDEQRALYRERVPSTLWQAPAMAVLVWFFLLELFITLGGAKYLAQFVSVQEIANLISSDIFLGKGTYRSEHDILLLKIFKIINVFSFPFKVWAIYVLTTPFWKNPKTFPISPMAIYWNEELTTSQRIRRSLWSALAFVAFVFVSVAGIFTLIWSDYGVFKHGALELSGFLDSRLWLWRSLGQSMLVGVAISCCIQMVVDVFSLISLIVSLFNHRKIGADDG